VWITTSTPERGRSMMATRSIVLATLVVLGVACGGARPDLTGGPVVWSTRDGKEVQRIEPSSVTAEPGRQMTSVVRFGDGLVAAGKSGTSVESNAAVWTSDDGIVWAQVVDEDLGGPGDQVIWDLVATGARLIAVGSETRDPELSDRVDPAVWTSDDGLEWVRVRDEDLAGSGRSGIWTVSTHGEVVVAGGESNGRAVVWTSPQGTDWSPAIAIDPDLDSVGAVLGLHSTSTGLIAVGVDDLDGAIWSSVEGVSWVRSSGAAVGGEGHQSIRAAAEIDGTVIVVGGDSQHDEIHLLGKGGTWNDTAAVWRRHGGETWHRVEDDALVGGFALGATNWHGKFVVVGIAPGDEPGDLDAAMWTSDDGLSWNRVASQQLVGDGYQDILDAIEFESRLVAVGGDDAP
jgi:hypothetical protein